MGWFKNTLDNVKDAASSQPVECPRGWGEVSFHLDLEGFPPFFSFCRKCPIGGVSSCNDCAHPFNPNNVEQLRATLLELTSMRAEGVLSDAEYATRRQQLIDMKHRKGTPGSGFHIASWMLGPIGLLITAAGSWLALKIHPGFFSIAGVGAVLLSLSLSFAMIASSKRKASVTESALDDPIEKPIFP